MDFHIFPLEWYSKSMLVLKIDTDTAVELCSDGLARLMDPRNADEMSAMTLDYHWSYALAVSSIELPGFTKILIKRSGGQSSSLDTCQAVLAGLVNADTNGFVSTSYNQDEIIKQLFPKATHFYAHLKVLTNDDVL